MSAAIAFLLFAAAWQVVAIAFAVRAYRLRRRFRQKWGEDV